VEDVKRWLPALLWAALIFLLSANPGTEVPGWAAAHDKLAHAVEYGVFGLLLARACGWRRAWLAVLIGVLYGVSDEFHQSFVPKRSGNDLGDMTADAVGSALGVGVYGLSVRLLRARAGDGTKKA
jgi:VanZ family protein